MPIQASTIQFSGGVSAYQNQQLDGVGNYLIWMCGKFGIKSESVLNNYLNREYGLPLFMDGYGNIYSYNIEKRLQQSIYLPNFPLIEPASVTNPSFALNLVNNNTKLWFTKHESYTNLTTFYEWDITLSPFTATYVKAYNTIVGLFGGACAVPGNDTQILLGGEPYGTGTIFKVDMSGNTPVFNYFFTLSNGRSNYGDLVYTTKNKILAIVSETSYDPYGKYLHQYDDQGNFEFEINLPDPNIFIYYSMVEYADGVYITGCSGPNDTESKLYKIETTWPYNRTVVGGIASQGCIFSASQSPVYCNNIFYPPI